MQVKELECAIFDAYQPSIFAMDIFTTISLKTWKAH
jgi:hypothetical protein